jgi:hypothetical protein
MSVLAPILFDARYRYSCVTLCAEGHSCVTLCAEGLSCVSLCAESRYHKFFYDASSSAAVAVLKVRIEPRFWGSGSGVAKVSLMKKKCPIYYSDEISKF